MKKRRGRRSFWWWSWLLLLVAGGFTAAGFYIGQKKWENAPKDYQATALVSFHVRAPFVGLGVAATTPSGFATSNELAVMREIRSDEALADFISEMDLAEKWGLGSQEAIEALRPAIQLDLDKTTQQLAIVVTRPDPQEASDLANAIASNVSTTIQAADEKAKAESNEALEVELEPFREAEVASRTALREALAERQIKIDPASGVDLGPYLFIPEVMSAKIEWDSAREVLGSTQQGQSQYLNYWARAVKPSVVTLRAEPPAGFVGPEVKPFQVEWSLYGLTIGLALGMLLSFACWKLFP